MKYLKLFENFNPKKFLMESINRNMNSDGTIVDIRYEKEEEEDKEYDPYSYKGCGCCPVCTGKKDCECGCPECNYPGDFEGDFENRFESNFINLDLIEEKNIPTNSSLWSQCKSWAKAKYDVWPSAYACGAAAKRYKSKGGKWKKSKKK
jgi:hypothetical protein